MKMHIFETKGRIWTLRNKYFSALTTAVYKDIVKENLQISTNHILMKLKPLEAYLKIMNIKDLQTIENFLK